MKITFDLPPNAVADLQKLAKDYASMEQAACASLCIGAAFLLKVPKLREETKAVWAKNNVEKGVSFAE